ncbi:lactoylglutathione lyase [Candidatus Kirkpatrickella diaphorinae]|uniref:lactoylglutathione lyase n=1 Tax=Candidatus Kirkpatrickella diaphorinae TaxID=2984322 RepID=A0ABY6GGV1_9PROT|nr:lactoylglutathione lyase [Candidatus Kirkpatrickella diaphorinae]UYH50474.1 lactoylglutathione lyase [Candidatus Kirkpatrickella diaphorinae]
MATFLHTMIRVRALDRSVDFYKALGMEETRRRDVPDGRYTLVYLGYGDGPEVELTHNWDQAEPYDLGNGFGHLAVGVEDIHTVVDKLRKVGVKVTREPGPVKFGTTVIAFVADPDGYKVELIETKPGQPF